MDATSLPFYVSENPVGLQKRIPNPVEWNPNIELTVASKNLDAPPSAYHACKEENAPLLLLLLVFFHGLDASHKDRGLPRGIIQ